MHLALQKGEQLFASAQSLPRTSGARTNREEDGGEIREDQTTDASPKPRRRSSSPSSQHALALATAACDEPGRCEHKGENTEETLLEELAAMEARHKTDLARIAALEEQHAETLAEVSNREKVAKARVGQLEETVQSLLAELDEAQKAAGAR